MIYYVPGCESEERFELMMKGTRICSEPIINSMRSHLVKGFTLETCVDYHGVDLSNLKRALSALNKKLEWLEQMKQLDWRKKK